MLPQLRATEYKYRNLLSAVGAFFRDVALRQSRAEKKTVRIILWLENIV